MSAANWQIHVQSLKEIIRQVAYTTGTTQLLDMYGQSRGVKREHLSAGTAAERFRLIYQTGVWVKKSGQRSSSGLGSELEATEQVRSELVKVLKKLGCQTLLDVGCGDWNWMQHVDLPCNYIGIDIVPEVIEANRQHERAGVSFQVCNAITDPLPPADAALCREVLFHLSFEDGLAVIRNICRSATWLIATSDAVWFNSNIRTGDFRMVNLQRAAYRLPEPIHWIDDSSVAPGRRLGVWSTEAIKASI